MNNESGNTLLIIGNGFDLQCKLKSSYSDFFAWLGEHKREGKVQENLWMVHFLENPPEGQMWVDVESSLEVVLLPKKRRDPIFSHWIDDAVTIRGYKYSYHRNHLVPERAAALYISCTKSRIGTDILTPYWFLNELKKFESQFSEYLRSEVAQNKEYLANATRLMDMITDGEQVHIINFNYTNPFVAEPENDASRQLSNMVVQVANVHGTIADDNIIFGVDLTTDLAPDAHIFTKTYRKMLQGTPNSSALPWHVNKIKFYGHSLGEADYSYFQSIFDNYNLYGDSLAHGRNTFDQVMLQFYFTYYGTDPTPDKKAMIEQDATERVYKLLTDYGENFDASNKAKGRNLLHKLLLEGRLQIKFLDDLDVRQLE